MSQVPLLLISDSPSSGSGLGRITGDLAARIWAELGEIFHVGVLGYGGPGSRAFNYQHYAIEGMIQGVWVLPTLPQIWQDFAGDERGVIMPIWDLSRTLWFSRPEYCPDSELKKWLETAKIAKWTYCAVDASGPHGKLSCMLRECLLGYDRVLAYSSWAKEIIVNTIGEGEAAKRDLQWLPHGIDTSVFRPRERGPARRLHECPADRLLIGIVATNQARKDWGLGIATVAEVAKKRPVRLVIKTDRLEHHWSIPALLVDYGLVDRTNIHLGYASDEQMAELYSACDVTIHPGLGEGFGYPIFESLACGTPVVHGNYGGAAEWLSTGYKIDAIADRFEGPFNCLRPVYDPRDWAARVLALADGRRVELPHELDWRCLWPRWKAWLQEGVCE